MSKSRFTKFLTRQKDFVEGRYQKTQSLETANHQQFSYRPSICEESRKLAKKSRSRKLLQQKCDKKLSISLVKSPDRARTTRKSVKYSSRVQRTSSAQAYHRIYGDPIVIDAEEMYSGSSRRSGSTEKSSWRYEKSALRELMTKLTTEEVKESPRGEDSEVTTEVRKRGWEKLHERDKNRREANELKMVEKAKI